MINLFFSVAFLVLSAAAATRATRLVAARSADNKRSTMILVWTVSFSTLFYVTFFSLGAISLVWDVAVVTPVFASMVALALYVGCRSMTKDVPVSSDVGAGELPAIARFGRMLSLPGDRLGNTVTKATFVVLSILAILLMGGFPQGYESWAYHLPIALHYLQTGTLGFWDTAYLHTFNANDSIYYAFLLGWLPERLIAPSTLLFLLPATVALYRLARETGADASASMLASLGLVTIPLVVFRALSQHADTPGLAFVAIAACFAIKKPDTTRHQYLLAGLAAGLAFGFKSLNLIPAVFLALVIGIQAWRTGGGDDRAGAARAALKSVLIFTFSALVIASFWLIRKYVEFGNPLYPLYVAPIFDILGWLGAPDFDYAMPANSQYRWVRSSVEWLVYPWVEWHRAGLYYNLNAGVGIFFTAMVPVSVLATAIGLAQRSCERKTVLALLLGGAVFVLGLWFALGNREPRYAIAALVFLLPLVAWNLSRRRGKARRIYDRLAVGCILLMLFVVLSKQTVVFGDRVLFSGMTTRHAYYEYPEALDRLPQGSTVVNLFDRPHNFFLAGSDHTNRVVSYIRSVRTLGINAPQTHQVRVEDLPEGFWLSARGLRGLGATHLFVSGKARLKLGNDVRLEEIGEYAVNPVNGKRLSSTKHLYRIRYCDGSCS